MRATDPLLENIFNMSDKLLLREYYELCPDNRCSDVILNEQEREERKRGALYLTGIIQTANKKNGNNRIYQKSVLEAEMKNYEKLINEKRAFGECVEEGSKILTAAGWKDFKDIAENEVILTLNSATDIVEKQQITEKIAYSFEGDVYHFKNRSLDIRVTPGHRFLLVDRYGEKYIATAEEIFSDRKKHDHSYIPKLGIWVSDNKDESFVLPGIEQSDWIRQKYYLREKYSTPLKFSSSVWCAFLGLWLAEGHSSTTGTHSNSIFISQNEGEKANKIRELLNQFPKEIEWKEDKKINDSGKIRVIFRTTDARIYRYLHKLGLAGTKYIPQEIKDMPACCLEELIEWFALGDGRRRNCCGHIAREVFSISEQLVLDLQECLFKSGGSGNIIEYTQRGGYINGRLIKAENCKPLHILHLSTTRGLYLKDKHTTIEKEKYSGMVYCVRVPNETFYCMNNGKSFWSMNCDHSDKDLVELKNVSHMLTRYYWEGDKVMGVLKVFDTPNGKILRSIIDGGGTLGVSSRALGSIQEQNGVDVVQEDLQMIAFDVVSDPSTPGAFLSPRRINESRAREIFTKADRLNRILNSITRS